MRTIFSIIWIALMVAWVIAAIALIVSAKVPWWETR